MAPCELPGPVLGTRKKHTALARGGAQTLLAAAQTLLAAGWFFVLLVFRVVPLWVLQTDERDPVALFFRVVFFKGRRTTSPTISPSTLAFRFAVLRFFRVLRNVVLEHERGWIFVLEASDGPKPPLPLSAGGFLPHDHVVVAIRQRFPRPRSGRKEGGIHAFGSRNFVVEQGCFGGLLLELRQLVTEFSQRIRLMGGTPARPDYTGTAICPAACPAQTVLDKLLDK